MTQMRFFRRFVTAACWVVFGARCSDGWLHARCLSSNGSFVPAETPPAKEVLAEAPGWTPASACGGRLAATLCPAHASVTAHHSGDQPVGSLQRAKDPSLCRPGGQPAEPVCHEEASAGEARRLERFTLCGKTLLFKLKGI